MTSSLTKPLIWESRTQPHAVPMGTHGGLHGSPWGPHGVSWVPHGVGRGAVCAHMTHPLQAAATPAVVNKSQLTHEGDQEINRGKPPWGSHGAPWGPMVSQRVPWDPMESWEDETMALMELWPAFPHYIALYLSIRTLIRLHT